MKIATNRRFGSLFFGISTCFFALLACNAPLGRETIPAPPTFITQPAATVTVETGTDADAAATVTNDSGVLPTFTPVGTPVLNSTPIGGTPAPTVTLPGIPEETGTPPPSQGDLSFTYQIEWSIDEQNPYLAVARVTIQAQGGNGQYTYYHDDIRQDGPVFTYQWAVCRSNPDSLRVDATDDQSMRVDYFERPPCPSTPTP